VTFDEYQDQALPMAFYPDESRVIYPALGLAGESGEAVEKVKKYLRDGRLDRAGLIKEMGDVLWYLSALSRDVGTTLGEVANRNLLKLADRQRRGTLSGEGDDR
jgi:NTP pyrophosphatase (non-canonical NTP hydrolase)